MSVCRFCNQPVSPGNARLATGAGPREVELIHLFCPQKEQMELPLPDPPGIRWPPKLDVFSDDVKPDHR
jgi:ribosomal protein L24E